MLKIRELVGSNENPQGLGSYELVNFWSERVLGGTSMDHNRGPLDSFNFYQRRTLEVILQEGSAFFQHQSQGPKGPPSNGPVQKRKEK